MKCERCGANPTGMQLHDYCAQCSRNLCDACMERGCCGEQPAISGEAQEASTEPPDAKKGF